MPDVHPYFEPWKIAGPSLALSSLAGNVNARHRVAVADLVLKRKNVRAAVIQAMGAVKPDLVALSAMTFQYDSAVRIARLVRQINPAIYVALGGYHATVAFESIAAGEEGLCFDFIFRQEADLSFDELLDCIETGRSVSEVRGLSFRTAEGFIHNPPRAIEDLGRISLPRRDIRLWKGYHFLGVPFDVIETSRGCLMECSFCSIRNMYGSSYRQFEVARVIADIENARRAGARSLFFADDNLTLDVKRFGRLCEAIVESGNRDLHYSVQVSSHGIASSDELVERMHQAGFKTVFLGMENISAINLKYLHKGDIVEKTKTAIARLKKHDIAIIGGLILGSPDDRKEDIEINYRFLEKMGLDTSLDQIVTPYLQTKLRDELLSEGLVTNDSDLKWYNGHFANVRTRHLTSDELSYLKWKHRGYVNTSESIGIFKTNIFKHYRWFILMIVPMFLLKNVWELVVTMFCDERQKFERAMQKDKALNNFDI